MSVGLMIDWKILVGVLTAILAILTGVQKLIIGNATIPEAIAKVWKWMTQKKGKGKSPPDFGPFREQLEKLRISASPGLRHLDNDQKFRLANPKIIIGDVFLDGEFLAFQGVKPEDLQVVWNPLLTPQLPEYVIDARLEIKRNASEKDRNLNTFKVFLDRWNPPIIDDGNQVQLIASKSDWFMRRGLKANAERLRADILDGHLSLATVSRPLDTDALVLTPDKKLILVLRGDKVSYEPNTWSLPGEQMDAEKDYDPVTKSPSPGKTIMRLLTERDELHLPEQIARSAEIKFMGLVTEWHMLRANLIAIVRLRDTKSTKVRDCFEKGEHKEITFVDFGPDRVEDLIRLIADGATLPVPGSTKRARLNDMTRISILAALFNTVGYFELLEHIETKSHV